MLELVALLVGIIFAPAPLAILALTFAGVRGLRPLVVPYVPHAKRAALAVMIVIAQPKVLASAATLGTTAFLCAAALASVLCVQVFRRWRGRVDGVIFSGRSATARSTGCIFLHGLGATAADVAPIRRVAAPTNVRMCWTFPSAPIRFSTVDLGLPRAAWFDVIAVDDTNKCFVTAEDLRDGVRHVLEGVEQLMERGAAPERCVLAGFSQGGALALSAALASPWPLAGVAVLSGFLACPHELDATLRCEANRGMSILWCHGVQDHHVPVQRMREGKPASAARASACNANTRFTDHVPCRAQE